MIIDRTEQVKREIRDRARQGMTVAGNVAVATAVKDAPHNMGNLRDGIFAKPVEEHGSELRLTIVDSVEYARFQEMGVPAGMPKRSSVRASVRASMPMEAPARGSIAWGMP